MEQNRFKSAVLWASVAAQVIALAGFFGLWSKIGVAPAEVEQIVSAVLQLLVMFGVLNNPTNPEGF